MSQIIDLKEKSLPQTCYVFKHSTACPISFTAADNVRLAIFDLPLYWINVREQRDLSNWVASEYGVTHQSPQLILIEEGKATKSWSHSMITSSVFSR